MSINYEYYRIFYYVAQCHSFTKAAQMLENNQPNITRCMNNLEEEVGCKLFVRTNRGVTLTPEGERLSRRVSIACEQLQLGEEELRRDCGLDAGTISVGASEIALHLLLLDRLSEFHAAYPGVHLKITNDSAPQGIQSLLHGRTDVAVVTTPNRVPAPLKVTNLMPFRDILLCGSQYKELASRMRSLKELSDYPLICLGQETSTYHFCQSLFVKHDLPFRVDMEGATMDQVLPMVSHNLGIGFCPEQLAAPAIASGEVYQIRLVEPIPERAVCLVEDTSRPQSIAMKTLRKLLCRDIAER